MRRGPLGAAAAVERREIKLIDMQGVVIAEAKRIYIERKFAIEPSLHTSVLVAFAGSRHGVHRDFVYNSMPFARGKLLLRNGLVQVPLEIVTVFRVLPHEVDQLHGVAALAPHDSCAPAVASFGQGVAGVAFAAAESGELAAELELETAFEEDIVGAPHGIGRLDERLDDLRGTGGRVIVVRADTALGVLELQHVAVFLAVIDDFRVFAVVLFHGVPPAAISAVALEIFLGGRIVVNADFAVLEVDKRDGVADNLG